jgi:hypothetical protein
MPEDNGSTTQAEGQRFSTDISILPEQQYNSASPFEEAGTIEHGIISPTSHMDPDGDLVPSSEETEVSQRPTTSSADRADCSKDTTLPSYGMLDLFGHDQTSYCFGEI